MLESARGTAVIAASDIDRARSFYEGVLGLKRDETRSDDETAFYQLGGVPLMVYRTSFAGTAQNTVFAVETDELAGDMASMRENGVVFKDYDFPGLKTVDGVAQLSGEKSAWFADSEGNVLALFQRN